MPVAQPQRRDLSFADFPIGLTFAAGPRVVTREDIVAFAEAFDPQPFHLDEDAAGQTPLGGLAASGWHTAALHMRLVYDAILWRTASLGAPGIDAVRWLHPVRPGDALRLAGRVTAARLSRTKADRGIVTFAFVLANQDGIGVMTQDNSVLIEARPEAHTP